MGNKKEKCLTCAVVGCYSQASVLCNGTPVCTGHIYVGREVVLEELEPTVSKQVRFAVPRGDRCQVPSCEAEAKYVCEQTGLRYCKEHKKPHGYEDSTGKMIRHTHATIKKWRKPKAKAKGGKNVKRPATA